MNQSKPHSSDSVPKELRPPISKSLTVFVPRLSGSRVIRPVKAFRGDQVLRVAEEPSTYLALELKTPRLDDIHHHLWLAGVPAAARPLHRQKLLGRSICITEDPNEHLVWFENQIFIKPLPDFLLDWESWNDCLCSDIELHKAACGLLLSYAWLVRHRSDLDIAREAGLLTKEIEWFRWVDFIGDFLGNINCETLHDVNPRYKYGELRLSRLNTIYRLAPPEYSLRNFVRGYRSQSTWSQAFFDRHFKWMLAVFAVLSVVLSALQVGLATATLQGNGPFQSASYGFTTASLLVMATSLVFVLCIWLCLFFYHLFATWRNDRAVHHKRLASASPP